MAEAGGDRFILKILNGLQSGVEVSLAPGDYSLGSGPDDDIQLVDVSLRPGHGRLRIAAGKIMLAGGAGALRSRNGVALEPGSDFQDIEPLDIVSAGSTRFALGRPTAQWNTLSDEDPSTFVNSGPSSGAKPPRAEGSHRWLRLLVPVGGLVAVLVLVGAYAVFGGLPANGARTPETRSDIEIVRDEIGSLPFTDRVTIREEADGRIIVSGYVDTLDQRRAVIKAIEGTATPTFPRIWVIAGIEAEVRSFIEASSLSVSHVLSPDGVLDLAGVVLDRAKADELINQLRQDVTGLADIRSTIKSADDFLSDVKDLAAQAKVDNAIVLRLDGTMIEANGAVPTDQVDNWIGFLQAYSRRFSDFIALRSFVTLQGVIQGKGDLNAVVLGPKDSLPPGNGSAIDPDRLREGRIEREDVFATPRRATEAATEVVTPVVPQGPLSTLYAAPSAEDRTDAARTATPDTVPEKPAVATAPAAVDALAADAKSAVDDLSKNGGTIDLRDTFSAMAGARKVSPAELVESYSALFRDPRRRDASAPTCIANGTLTAEALPPVLFWLDVMSFSTSLTLSALDRSQQQVLLEAALNPDAIDRCARRSPSPQGEIRSVYIEEARRNRNFIRFITRSLPAFDMEISGARLSGDRFVQTVSGERFGEGAAPTAETRVAMVGELGVLIQRADGFSAILYGDRLVWRVGP